MKTITLVLAMLCATGFSFGVSVAEDFDDQAPEQNVLHSNNAIQEKVKSVQDDKNVISDSDDRDEDTYVKSSENPLNDDAFDFNPNPDGIRDL